MNYTNLLYLCYLTHLAHAGTSCPHHAYVQDVIVDVLSDNNIAYTNTAPTAPYHTPNMLAQLLYNEQVIVEEISGPFSKISIPSQIIFINNNWEPITGWVASSSLKRLPDKYQDLPAQKMVVCIVPWTAAYHEDPKNRYAYTYIMPIPFGTRLIFRENHHGWTRVILPDGRHACIPQTSMISLDYHQTISQKPLRKIIVDRARQFIGMPYCWGGMSPHQPCWSDKLSGVDCSGLAYLVWFSCNIAIPRNSRSQYYAATPCDPRNLQAADFVFLAHEKITSTNNTIFHVLIYTGDQSLIESYTVHHKPDYDTQPVREVSVRERLGKDLHDLQQGMRCPQGYYCYFGSLLPRKQ